MCLEPHAAIPLDVHQIPGRKWEDIRMPLGFRTACRSAMFPEMSDILRAAQPDDGIQRKDFAACQDVHQLAQTVVGFTDQGHLKSLFEIDLRMIRDIGTSSDDSGAPC